jgi:hypothetical protein
MSQQVDARLSQIERLDDEDRILLQQQLAELADAQWQAEATKARAIAVDLGINQDSIDRAVSSQPRRHVH